MEKKKGKQSWSVGIDQFFPSNHWGKLNQQGKRGNVEGKVNFDQQLGLPLSGNTIIKLIKIN